jgi:hypothetical protein
MKKVIYIFLFISSFISLAQVGVGTTTPKTTSILDVTSTEKGILIPRMTENQRNNIISPEKSLLIFNTTSNSFEYNSGNNSSKSWTSIKSYGNSPSVKYSSVASTDNINTATATNIKLFNNLDWNDNLNVYAKVNESEITITEPGRYEITCNVYIQGQNTTNASRQRTGVEMFLAVNGIQVGVNSATAYIRWSGNVAVRHDTSSLHINETFETNSTSSTISVKTIRKAQTGNVTVLLSNIIIKKVR